MQVLDNFLPADDFKKIQDTVLSPEFTWTYWHRVGDENDPPEWLWNSKFVHIPFQDTQLTSALNMLSPFINDLRLEVKAMKRIIINSYPYTQTVEKHAPHEDYDYPHKGALLNLTTCNGFTYVEGKEIKSVENRVILFNPSLPHYGTTTSNSKRRVIINFNYF